MPFTFEAESGEIPVGQHDVEIVEATPKTVGDPPKDKLLVTFEARDGSQVVDWLTKSKPSKFRWEQLWSAAGVPFADDGGKVTFDETRLVGRRVHIEVIDDEYNGTVRRKVKEVFAPVEPDVPFDMPEREPASEQDDSEVPF
jgi:hypothetical protein